MIGHQSTLDRHLYSTTKTHFGERLMIKTCINMQRNGISQSKNLQVTQTEATS